jgi:hypothetical protein
VLYNTEETGLVAIRGEGWGGIVHCVSCPAKKKFGLIHLKTGRRRNYSSVAAAKLSKYATFCVRHINVGFLVNQENNIWQQFFKENHHPKKWVSFPVLL